MYLLRHSRGTQTDIQVDRDGHIYYYEASSSETTMDNMHASSDATRTDFNVNILHVDAHSIEDSTMNSQDSSPTCTSSARPDLESTFLPIHREEEPFDWDTSPAHKHIPSDWEDMLESYANQNQEYVQSDTAAAEHMCALDAEGLKREMQNTFNQLGELFKHHQWIFQGINMDNWFDGVARTENSCTPCQPQSEIISRNYSSDSAYFSDSEGETHDLTGGE